MIEQNALLILRLESQSWTGTLIQGLRRWPVVPVFILGLVVLCGLFATWVSPHNPIETSLWDRNDEPFWFADSSGKFILGADPLGRDVLSRVIHGAQISLIIAVVALSTGTIIGTSLGLISGFYGGHTDEIIMRSVDINGAIPFILLALIVVIVFGQSLAVLLVILAWGTWSAFARQVRGEALQIKAMDYVSLARVTGASDLRIMYKHILPGVVNTVIVVATLRVGALIMAEAILSFLGAGIPPPTPAWGAMISEGKDYLASAWWVAFFPGMAIFLTVLALNFLGDWLRDHYDPRLRQIN